MSTSDTTNDSRAKRQRTESDKTQPVATPSTTPAAISSSTKDFLEHIRTTDAQSSPSPTIWPARSTIQPADWKNYMELVTESLVQNATQEIANMQTNFIKTNLDRTKQRTAITNLADPEFLPRSIRLKIALSAPSFMRETPLFTSEDEALQLEIKAFQESVKTRFSTIGQATIDTLTNRLQVQFVKDLKELAKICFLTLHTTELGIDRANTNLYAQAALQRTLRGLTDATTLEALSITHAELRELATSTLSTAEKEDFAQHTVVTALLEPAEDNTDELIIPKVCLELVSTILLQLAPFLTSTPLKEKQHQLQKQQIKKDIKAYLKNRQTTDETEKIDAVLTDNAEDKEAALKQLIASETSVLTRKIASLEGQVKQNRKKSSQRDTAKTSSGNSKSPSKSQKNKSDKKGTAKKSKSPKNVTFKTKPKTILKKKKGKANHDASEKEEPQGKKNSKTKEASSKKNSSGSKNKKQGKRQKS